MTRKPKPPKRARLRDIDKPLIATYGRRYHANRDFVTARVARNRRRFRRILIVLAVLLLVGAAAGWWTLTRPASFAVDLASRDGVPPDREPAMLLAKVGLAERTGHFPSQLSGGEQQRVAARRDRRPGAADPRR